MVHAAPNKPGEMHAKETDRASAIRDELNDAYKALNEVLVVRRSREARMFNSRTLRPRPPAALSRFKSSRSLRQNHNFASDPFYRFSQNPRREAAGRRDLLPRYLTWLSSDAVGCGQHRDISSRNPSFIERRSINRFDHGLNDHEAFSFLAVASLVGLG